MSNTRAFTVSALIRLPGPFGVEQLEVFMASLDLAGMLDPAVTSDDLTLGFTAQVEADTFAPAVRMAGEAISAAMAVTYGLAGIKPEVLHLELTPEDEIPFFLQDDEPLLKLVKEA